jgi:hypothetical protein
MIFDARARVHHRRGDDSMAMLDDDAIWRVTRKTCVHISRDDRAKHFLDIAPPCIHTEGIGDDRFHRVLLALFSPAEHEGRRDIAFFSRKRLQVRVETFRQTHQIPPMRAPHNTTKAVRVNMSPRENVRFAPQVNRISSIGNHLARFRKNRGRHSCKLHASSAQSNPDRRRTVGATGLHETHQSLRTE